MFHWKTKAAKLKEHTWNVILTCISAALVAFGMHIFIYPSDFAPSGVDGIATMLQSLTSVNAGVFTLLINVPLLAAAWFVLKKRYVLYTVLYTVLFSGFLIILQRIDFYQYTAPTERLLPAIFGGVAQGLTGIMLRIGASSGGVDVVGSMIQRRMPHRNLESIISLISISIVALSYFVYRDLNSLLLSVVEIFVCERVTASILRDSRNAVKFEVVTDHPDAIKRDILYELNHGATVIDARGLYSDREKQMIVCVVSYRQIGDFLRIVSRYEGTFAYYSDVMGVRGNFERGQTVMGKIPKKK